ncbi:MAG TPA: AraC family transcriptional regulator [Streptosporangiaceae bacterium]|nr:AraC family transcriptional regulator [Streptosporangiaceae bacterium]
MSATKVSRTVIGVDQRRAREAFMPATAEAVQPQRFRTCDMDTARDHVARTFADHDLSMAGVRDLDFQLDVAPSCRIILGQMSYGADVSLVAPPMRLCYHVNLPVTGQTVAAQNGDRRTSVAGETGVAFLPDGPLAIRWSPDALQYVIKFPKELLEAHAAKLAGCPVGETLRFDLTFDLTSPAAQALIATAGFMYAELARPGGLARIPAACHEMESALMTQLLMVVPSQLTGVLHGGPARSRQARIRQVMEYIEENPAAAASTAELAALAGISARALQVGFHDVVGMSPSAYVRGVRLDRVHLDLLSGDTGSVTEVAGRWGFFHPGRFASQYRQRFGLLPSETARVAGGGG